MMDAAELDVTDISPDLAAWAARAGYQVTHGDPTVIWSNHGEVRYFIRRPASGWFRVTSSDRMSEEVLAFAAQTMELIELYFYGKCGLSLRSSLKLPPLQYPRSAADTTGGYTLRTTLFEGRQNLALVGDDGFAIALTTSGKIVGTAELVCLSYYLVAGAEAIKSSYLDPSGQPLFTTRPT